MDALIIIFVTALAALFGSFAKKPALVIGTTIVGILGAIVSTFVSVQYNVNYISLGDYKGLSFNEESLYFSMGMLILTLIVSLLSYERFKEKPNHTGEYLGLMLFSLCGAMMMTAFTDFFMFFLALEILSIPVYVLVGSNKEDVRSTEAAIKYFLMGSFATGIILFGIAWIYGATTTFDFAEMFSQIQVAGQINVMLIVGLALLLGGFIFKVGAAPFHFWGPDVYDGAPTPVTGYMASVVKLAAFIGFGRMVLWFSSFDQLEEMFSGILTIVIILSLFVGNLSALRQTKLKRVMAYSSIVHVGYTLIIFLNPSLSSTALLFFYMGSYGLGILGIIAVNTAINDKEDEIEALRGLGKRNPFLATVAVISILSLAGIPPTAGFFGKYLVFSSLWNSYWWLILIALVNSGISIYYYLKIIIVILSKNDETSEKIKIQPLTAIALIISTVGTIGLGFLFSYLTKL